MSESVEAPRLHLSLPPALSLSFSLNKIPDILSSATGYLDSWNRRYLLLLPDDTFFFTGLLIPYREFLTVDTSPEQEAYSLGMTPSRGSQVQLPPLTAFVRGAPGLCLETSAYSLSCNLFLSLR